MVYPLFVVLIVLWVANLIPSHIYVLGLGLLFASAPIIMIMAVWGMCHVWNTGYRGGKRATLSFVLMLPLFTIAIFAGRNLAQGVLTYDIWTGDSLKPDYMLLSEERQREVYRREIPTFLKEGDFLKRPPPPPPSMTLDLTFAEVVSFATLAARDDMGWEIWDEIPTAFSDRFRFEATDYTIPLFFPDDIIVVFDQQDDGIHVNARSSSRIGNHDFGANQQRILNYFLAIERRAADSIYNPEGFVTEQPTIKNDEPEERQLLPTRKPRQQ